VNRGHGTSCTGGGGKRLQRDLKKKIKDLKEKIEWRERDCVICLNPLYQDTDVLDGAELGRVVELHCEHGRGKHMVHRNCAQGLTACPWCRGVLYGQGGPAIHTSGQLFTPVVKRHAQLKAELAELEELHEKSKERRSQRCESLRVEAVEGSSTANEAEGMAGA